MAQTIIHHKGVYNIYCSITDSPIFESGLTVNQVESYIKERYGSQGLRDLADRIKRAELKGTSSHIAMSLVSEIICNHAGPNGTEMGFNEFVAKFLTLKD